MSDQTKPSAEQQARDLLERLSSCTYHTDPQRLSGGDVVELANMIARLATLEAGQGKRITLTALEIKDLAQFTGLRITDELTEDEKEVEITITTCPGKGVLDESSGKTIHTKHIAYFDDIPEEGCLPLGNNIERGELKVPR